MIDKLKKLIPGRSSLVKPSSFLLSLESTNPSCSSFHILGEKKVFFLQRRKKPVENLFFPCFLLFSVQILGFFGRFCAFSLVKLGFFHLLRTIRTCLLQRDLTQTFFFCCPYRFPTIPLGSMRLWYKKFESTLLRKPLPSLIGKYSFAITRTLSFFFWPLYPSLHTD